MKQRLDTPKIEIAVKWGTSEKSPIVFEGLQFPITIGLSEDETPEVNFSIVPGDISDGWEIITPLPVTLIFSDDGEYILSDDIFNVYGTGETFQTAKEAYLTNLKTYYAVVEHNITPVNPTSQDFFDFLQEYIRQSPE